MQNPFEDLLPNQKPAPSRMAQNPFADLMQQNTRPSAQPEEQPSVSARAMSALLNQQSPFAPRSRPEEEKYWGTTEKIAGSLMDYAPFFIGGTGLTKAGATALSKFPATAKGLAEFTAKHPKLAKYIPDTVASAIGGAGYGAATGKEGERLGSALEQGAIGAGIPIAGATVVDPLLRYGAKKYAQSAIPAFTEKAGEKIKELLSTGEYSKKLQERFLGASKANKENWKEAEKVASELDVLRGTSPLNVSPYQKYIQEYGQNISKMEPAIRAPYAQSIEAAKRAGELAPESFSGIMAARKNLNQNIGDYLKKESGGNFNPQTRESKEFVKGLQSNLKNETLEANKGLVGEENLKRFQKEWESANKSHQNLQKFYKSPEKMTGVERDKAQTTIREAFKASLPESMGGKNVPLDPSMIGRYLPSLTPNGAQGVQGMKQLAKIMGSKKEAVEAAKAHIFRPQIENGAKTVDVAARYGQLSPSQRKYLFGNSEEGKMLDAINKTRLAFGREPEKTLAKIGHGMMSLGIPGGLGFAGGLASGESWDKSLMTGLATAAASKGIKGLAGKTATPSTVNRAINFGKGGMTNFGRNANYIGQAYMNTPPERR
jgi:hypothetical protein